MIGDWNDIIITFNCLIWEGRILMEHIRYWTLDASSDKPAAAPAKI